MVPTIVTVNLNGHSEKLLSKQLSFKSAVKELHPLSKSPSKALTDFATVDIQEVLFNGASILL